MAGDDVRVRVGADGAEQVDSELKRASESVKRMGKAASDAAKQMERDFARIAQYAAGLGKALAAFGASISAGFVVGVKAAGDFQKQLGDIGKTANASTAEIKRVSDAVLAMSSASRTNQGPKALAEGVQALVSAGLSLKDSTSSIEAIGRVATATDSQIADVAKTAFQLQSALKIDPTEMKAAFDTMAFAGKAGAFELRDMAEFMPTLASAAASLGIQGREGLASLSSMIQMVRKDAPDASTAATRLTDAMMKMTSPEAMKNFAKFGVDIERVMKDARANGINPMEAALKELQRVTGGDTFRLGEIFQDKEAKLALMSLMKYRQEYESLRDASGGKQAAGTVDRDFEKSVATFQGQMQALQNSLQRLGIVMGTALLPVAQKVVGFVNGLIEAFNALPKSTQETIAKVVALAGAFAAAAGALLMFAPQIAAVKALFAGGALSSAITAITGALSSLALPIAAVVAALGALYVAWQNNWGGIQEHTRNAVSAVGRFLVDGFARIREFVVPLWGEMWTAVRFAFARVVEELRPAARELGAFLVAIWPPIRDAVKAAWDIILPIVRGGFRILVEIGQTLLPVFRGIWSTTWSAVKGIVSAVWPIIRTSIENALTAIRTVLEVFSAALKGDWQGAWDALVKGMTEIGGRVVNATRTVMQNVVNSILDFEGHFTNAGQALMQAFQRGFGDWGMSSALDEYRRLQDQARGGGVGGGSGFNLANILKPFEKLLGKSGTANLGKILGGTGGGTPGTMPDAFPDVPGLPNSDKSKKTRTLLDLALDMQRRGYPGATITSGYNDPRGVSKYRSTPGLHAGYDIAMPAGAPVRAALSGVVTQVAHWFGNEFGVTVKDALGRTLTYGHISPSVKPGTPVRAGDTLGTVVVDHVDIKARDARGNLFDFAGLKATGANAGGDRLVSEVMGILRAIAPPSTGTEFDAQRAATVTKFGTMSKRAQELGLGPDVTDALDMRREERLQQIAAAEAEALEKQVEGERKATADRLALVEGLHTGRMEDFKREQDLHAQRYQQKLTAIEQDRALNLITDEEAMARRVAELDATNLQGQALMEARVGFGQQYQEYLTQQQELQGEQYVTWLQTQETRLQELAKTSTAAQVQLGMVRQALHQQERARWEQMKATVTQIADSIGSHFQSFLEGVISGTKKFGDAFGELWKNIASTIIAEISRIIAKMIAMKIVQAALGLFTGGLSTAVSATGAMDFATGMIPIAHTGGLVVPGGIRAFHTGGMVGASLRSDEVFAKLQTGEMVLSRAMVGNLGKASEQPGAGGDINITIDHFEAHHTDDVHGLARQLGQMIRYDMQAK